MSETVVTGSPVVVPPAPPVTSGYAPVGPSVVKKAPVPAAPPNGGAVPNGAKATNGAKAGQSSSKTGSGDASRSGEAKAPSDEDPTDKPRLPKNGGDGELDLNKPNGSSGSRRSRADTQT